MTKLILGAAVAVAISQLAWAQPATARPSFEVASVKAAPPFDGKGVYRVGCTGGPGTGDPGRITCDNYSLRSLLMKAYDLKNYQISGPDWVASTNYNIVATVPPNTTKEQVLEMWQNLLADRLKLTVHRESKELPIYALVVAKNGPKLDEASDDPTPGAANTNTGGGTGVGGGSGAGASGSVGAVSAGASPSSGSGASSRRGRLTGPKMTIAQLVIGLGFHLDRPVIDMTGLTARYKVKLEWQDDPLSSPQPVTTGATAESSAPTASSTEAPSAPTIFAAVQEQLGLKLDARKSPIDLLVVDHAEKIPIEN